MNIFETITSAIQNIVSNKMRTLLTTLGIVIGISSVIMITSIGDGVKNAMNEMYSNISSQFRINVNQSDKNNKPTSRDFLTLKDIDALKRYEGITHISPYYYGYTENLQLLDSTETKMCSFTGVYPDYLQLNDSPLLYGRYIAEADITAMSNVVVINNTTAKKVFGREDVVGEKIVVKGAFGAKKYNVIGVLKNENEEMDAIYGDYWSEDLYMPITTVMARMGTKYIPGFFAKVADKNKVNEIMNDVISKLEKAHGNAGKGMYLPQDYDSQVQQINGTLTMMTMFIVFVAAISLLVGGIGVMNIMMVTVTERTREIGIRKSIGARNSDIRIQFVIEAIILTSIGGIIGIIVGVLGGKGLASLIPPSLFASMFGRSMQLKASISINAVIISVSISSLIGIIFGVYPANKAAKLDPIEALRYE